MIARDIDIAVMARVMEAARLAIEAQPVALADQLNAALEHGDMTLTMELGPPANLAKRMEAEAEAWVSATIDGTYLFSVPARELDRDKIAWTDRELVLLEDVPPSPGYL